MWCVRIKGPIVRDVRPVRSENRQFRTRTITTAAVRGKPIQARTLLLGRLSVVRLVPSYSNLIFIYILLLIRDFVAHNRNGIVEERIAVERRVRVLRPVNASETTLRYSASGRCENGQALTNRRANWPIRLGTDLRQLLLDETAFSIDRIYINVLHVYACVIIL